MAERQGRGLHGQGDFQNAARRGRSGWPRRRVLSVQRLQSLVWPGAGRADAVCRFCDTDFVGTDGPGGGRFETAEALAATIERNWASQGPLRFVVFTGGEPLQQLDPALISAVHKFGFEIAVETNGTQAPVDGID